MHEKLIKQIKNEQEIIANVPKDSHPLEDTNPEAVAEQEAMQRDAGDNEDQSDADLETLDHRDLPALRRAKAELETRHKKKNLDLFFRARVTSMIALINLFLDPELDYGWMKCSKLVAKAVGKGSINHARNLRRWVVAYIQHGSLPLNRYGRLNTSILDDEDLAQQIHLHLIGIAKDGYVRAQNVVDMMATPDLEMKCYLSAKTAIRLSNYDYIIFWSVI